MMHNAPHKGGALHSTEAIRHSFIKQHWDAYGGGQCSSFPIRALGDLIRRLNIGLRDDYIDRVVKAFEAKNKPVVTLEQFDAVVADLTSRSELLLLFHDYAGSKPYLIAEDLRRFLVTEQKDPEIPLQALRKLIISFDGIPLGNENYGMHFLGFLQYMTDPWSNGACDIRKQQVTYQDMNQTLEHYYISSSTALRLVQWTSKAHVLQMYENLMKVGCRCIELECWLAPTPGVNTISVCKVSRTGEGGIPLEDVLATISKWAFYSTPFPLILCFNMHFFDRRGEEVISENICTVLGPKLFRHWERTVPKLTPKALMNKILIHKKPHRSSSGGTTRSVPEETSTKSGGWGWLPANMQSPSPPRPVTSPPSFGFLGRLSPNTAVSDPGVVVWQRLLDHLKERDVQQGGERGGGGGGGGGHMDDRRLMRQESSGRVFHHKRSNSNSSLGKMSVELDLSAVLMDKVEFEDPTDKSAGATKPKASMMSELSRRFSSVMGSPSLGSSNEGSGGRESPSSTRGRPWRCSSAAPEWAVRAAQEDPEAMILFTMDNLVHVHPHLQQDQPPPLSLSLPSSPAHARNNIDPVPFWTAGIQLVDMDYLSFDRAMWIQAARFRDNGSCGYLLKSEYMRNPDHPTYTDLFSYALMPVTVLAIKIISGQQLQVEQPSLPRRGASPPPYSETDDSVQPYVEIEVSGIPADCRTYKTTVQRNGFDPIWNLRFEFPLSAPALAILRLTVYSLRHDARSRPVSPSRSLEDAYPPQPPSPSNNNPQYFSGRTSVTRNSPVPIVPNLRQSPSDIDRQSPVQYYNNAVKISPRALGPSHRRHPSGGSISVSSGVWSRPSASSLPEPMLDTLVAHEEIPVSCLRQGFRHVFLRDAEGTLIPHASLFCHFESIARE